MTPITANARILVVDDEPPVLLTLKAILEQEGYAVDAAAEGATALRMVREHRYDLVLTDLKMPGVDGMAVLKGVRNLSPETVTVMLTGYGSLDSALEAVQQGAYEYLLKPVEIPHLKLVVQRSLERKRFSEIEVLYRVSQALPQGLGNPGAIAAQVAEATRQVLGISDARLLWFDAAGELQPEGEAAVVRELLQESAVRERLASGEIIGAENAGAELRKKIEAGGAQSFVLIPGNGKRRLNCVLWAHNGEQVYEFHASAQRFLCALVAQASIALENAALLHELQANNSALEAANRKLAELDRLKSQFLSVATHELRTPLTLLLGYNSMLAENLDGRVSEEERGAIDESVTACKRLIRLVNSMLDLSQIQSGSMRMEFSETDVRSLIRSTVTLFQHEAASKGVTLASTVPARLPRTHADPERLQQALINLVGNALKFTPTGGAIQIQARHLSERNMLQISVSDNGVGIPPEEQAHIFDEFGRARRAGNHRKKQGAGLGLAITRRVVEAHGGEISVNSKFNQGSTFTISLPLRHESNVKESANVAMSA
jgi:signal transduction histidine kinase